jgi:hypothetical protein
MLRKHKSILNLKITFMKKWIPLLLFLLFYISCENEQEPAATIEFKTGIGYISNDATISKGSSLTVGIVADKAENNLKSYNVSVSYDGASTTITVRNLTIPSDENSHYDKDVNFTVRNQAGTEKYYFTILDVDGNIVQKTLTFRIE